MLQFHKHVLPNGLTIIGESNSHVHSCALDFVVETGARDESPELSGVSHFLEHMMFKGTKSRTWEDVNREFDEMGAEYNAATGEETTEYYAFILPEYLEATIALWADILQPSLREDDFQTEKKVIIEEIQESLDQPLYGAEDICKELYFKDHPLARSILGTEESIQKLKHQQMRKYFQQQYSASNITLFVTGKFDFENLVDIVKKYCGHWSSTEISSTSFEPEAVSGLKLIEESTSTQEYVIQFMKGPSPDKRLRPHAELFCNILASSTGSRLYWELIETGLAESLSIGFYDYRDCGLIASYLSCAPENTKNNLNRMNEHFVSIADKPITQAELDQARNKIKSRKVLSAETPRGRLFGLTNSWIQSREYYSIQDEIAFYDQVTVESLKEFAKDYPLCPQMTVGVGPLTSL